MKGAANLAAILLVAAGLPLATQAPPRPFKSGVELVEVPVVVCGADGRFVPGLGASDFEVFERGEPQAIAAFDHVSIPIWRPDGVAGSPPPPADVATNERLTEGRVFVLLLDALHVSSPSLAVLKGQARKFVLESVGPADMVAVLSPGAVDAAAQDFTADKARMLAAIDAFSGTALRSATLELEDERQAAALTGVVLHAGKDPSDKERAGRAASLASVLEGIARHLARVERRRKSVLLFSEGIDYNIGDVMGGVQQHAADVTAAVRRATGALLRADVSVYAIDPRALAGADTAGDRLLPYEAPNAPRADGSLPRLDFSEPSREGEYAASIASLRHVAETTGGFAAVAGNDVGATFDRIIRESSDYYVIGYSPSAAGRPGEFRPIRVRVRRPGLRVVARRGYVVSAPPHAAAPPAPEPEERSVMAFSTPLQRGRGTERPLLDGGPAPTAPRGLAPAMATLLSSPLPVAGLPLRVQAAPVRAGGKKQVVQLVTEVLGAPLRFAERRGRFEARLELASFTVDARGRGRNGRSTRIDLRLTPEELERVKAGGIRWMSHVELEPGRYQLRVAAREPASAARGMVTVDVEVPSFGRSAALSGVLLTSPSAALMITRGELRLATRPAAPPTAARTFAAGERIDVIAEAYADTCPAAVTMSVERIGGGVVARQRQEVAANTAAVAVPIDTAGFSPGRYILRVRLEAGGGARSAERLVPFEVVSAAPASPSIRRP